MKHLLFLCLICFCCPVLALSNYAAIDNFAKQMRRLKSTETLEAYTKRLIRPFKTDEAKARVILAWIVFNIDYDSYRKEHEKSADIEMELDIQTDPQTGKQHVVGAKVKDTTKNMNTVQQTLATRLGLCKDIAKLYQTMGQYAGLHVEIITGFICTQNSDLAGHMWNAVNIDGTWKYVDPTWAVLEKTVTLPTKTRISAQMKEKAYKKALTKRSLPYSAAQRPRTNRSVLNEWFFTDGDAMIQTHYPLERRWQLQKNQIVFEDFLNQSCQMSLDDLLKKADPE